MVAAWSVAGLLLAPGAFAAPPPVSLALEGCSDLNAPEVERIFAAELGATSTPEAGPGVTEVTVTCEGVRLLVRVKDPLSRKTVQRSFDGTTFDDRAVERLVALAASELVLASWAELYANPVPQVRPEGPEPPIDAAAAALDFVRERALVESERPRERRESRRSRETNRPDERALRVLALGSVRSFPGRDTPLFGGGARIGEEPIPIVSYALDALVERTVESPFVTTATIGASLFAYYRVSVLTLRIGAGLRAGLVTENRVALAPWGWPLGTTAWTLRLQSFVMDLSGEAGYVVLPFGDSSRGYWLSGQLGVGMVM